MIKQDIAHSIRTQKQKQFLVKVTLMIYLNQFILIFSQTSKNLLERKAKADKDFAKKFDFKGIIFSVKIRNSHKTEKRNNIGIRDFGYEGKTYMKFVSQKNAFKKNILIYY